MEDKALPMANGGASTTASGTAEVTIPGHDVGCRLYATFYDRNCTCTYRHRVQIHRLEAALAAAEYDRNDKCQRLQKLTAALRGAVAVIKGWHNADDVWDIYYDNAPEMRTIREALAKMKVDGTAQETSTRSADE